MRNDFRWVLLSTLISFPVLAQQATSIEWPAYANDRGGTHYSKVAEVDRRNVRNLRTAWTYHTGALVPATDLNRKAAFECTPVMVDGLLYVITPFDRVIALDPSTGKERWSYDPKVDRTHDYSEVSNRGVAVWRDNKAVRLFFGTLTGRLIALDGKTGALCLDFGNHGQIDLHGDVDAYWNPDYEVTSPPTVVGNVVIVGSSIGDNSNFDTGRGTVRAFDVHSGKLLWAFDPLPPSPSMRTGAANVWAPIAADVGRGLVFLPTSSPSPDYFGGLRPGDDRNANSVVALEAATGKMVWSFQVVHHDLWDYDVASQPTLVDVKRNGRSVPAVAVTTKIGHLFILDRLTGKPLFPVEERAVPKSDIEGEVASATQPFPTNAPLVSMTLAESDVWGATQDDRDFCHERWKQSRYEGLFTPPSVQGTIVYPSNVGGVNWGGSSYDPVRHLLITQVNRWPVFVRLIPRKDYNSQNSGADNRFTGEFARQSGTPFGMYREDFAGKSELPCIAPPWGILVAMNLSDGSKRWEVPLGSVTTPGGVIRGLPGLGGSLVTGGGLIFVSATVKDDSLRAYDVDTGEEIWRSALPAGAQSTPMTYRYHGRQYIVICAGGHGKAQSTMGDSVIAFALP